MLKCEYKFVLLISFPRFLISACGIRVIERIVKEQGKPTRFRTDNSPEFISREFRDWCGSKEIEIQYIQPGRPMQNVYIERFNRTFWERILNAYLFEDTLQLQILAEKWI